jgi:hypothetical protein
MRCKIEKRSRRPGNHAWDIEGGRMKFVSRLTLALLMVTMVIMGATAAEKAKSMTVHGKVTAASGDSLTIAKGSESMTFTVDQSTKVLGKGLTTKSNEKAAAGQKMTLSDTVATGDMVAVTYHEMDGKMHAATVRVQQKAMTSK